MEPQAAWPSTSELNPQVHLSMITKKPTLVRLLSLEITLFS